MHVRIAQFNVPPDNWDQTVREIEDSVVPAVQRVPCFVAGFFVGDRSSNRTWGIVSDTASRRPGYHPRAGLELAPGVP